MDLLLLLLLTLFVGYAGLVLFYYIFQERFIFVRYPVLHGHKFNFEGDFEERFIQAPDGASLHALYFRAGLPQGVILYFHGNTGTLRRWGKHAARFTELGYNVLMPDYRGYGKSRGRLSEEALHSDAKLWYESLLNEWKEKEIVIYGRSLGSGMATPLAASKHPRMLLLETPFANLFDLARSYLPILPYRLLLRYRFQNDKVIRNVKCPVYIFHGKRDNVVPFTSALKLYSCIPSNIDREMFTFPKAHHNDIVRFPRFGRTLRKLLGVAPVRSALRPS
ncbi:MAG: alpha/beta hydrolase [Bacteroidota bacterium]|nr:alpha/beta hydrolase [Bacteroidota bacterium]